ncbi:hypothetical protein SGLAM104S_04400 [Streptomyces glaucescens]
MPCGNPGPRWPSGPRTCPSWRVRGHVGLVSLRSEPGTRRRRPTRSSRGAKASCFRCRSPRASRTGASTAAGLAGPEPGGKTVLLEPDRRAPRPGRGDRRRRGAAAGDGADRRRPRVGADAAGRSRRPPMRDVVQDVGRGPTAGSAGPSPPWRRPTRTCPSRSRRWPVRCLPWPCRCRRCRRRTCRRWWRCRTGRCRPSCRLLERPGQLVVLALLDDRPCSGCIRYAGVQIGDLLRARQAAGHQGAVRSRPPCCRAGPRPSP